MLRLNRCLMIIIATVAVMINNAEAGQVKGVSEMSDALIVYETIAREASDNYDDYLGVAYTIRNRVLLGWSKSYREACLKPFQYSCWNQGVEQVERTPEQISMAKDAFDFVLSSKSDFPATHYHHENISPSWASSPQMKYLCTISKHRYYQEIR